MVPFMHIYFGYILQHEALMLRELQHPNICCMHCSRTYKDEVSFAKLHPMSSLRKRGSHLYEPRPPWNGRGYICNFVVDAAIYVTAVQGVYALKNLWKSSKFLFNPLKILIAKNLWIFAMVSKITILRVWRWFLQEKTPKNFACGSLFLKINDIKHFFVSSL